MLKLLRGLTIAVTLFCLAGCHSSDQANNSNKIRVGTIAGPETQLMEVAKTVAANQYGLNIEIVQFSDYTMPNEALADGSIDANMFQHLPYLQQAIRAKGYQLVPIGKTFVYPMALYSKKITKLSDLHQKATVAIPNDPSNRARALLLLQKANLIKLRSGADVSATVKDISENPKQLKIEEIDAAQLPRILPDVDLAAINTNYAMVAKLIPSHDGLFIETSDSPYANLIVVRAQDKEKPQLQRLVDALHSPEVLQKAEELFQGQAIPAWK
ncbi:MAG: MetQ/NlpA family ABC transporter substrate-binding protein [Coxiellaceae bacterium]|nr:MAG: MetQ/NlpA family ABC transporter substrate-binding protein [Coxiellaceae bacterium]